MSVVAVVGGNGQIARILHGILTERGHTPVALVRKEEQASALGAEGVQTRLLDIEAADEGQFASAFQGCDAVVFAAGGGPDGSKSRKLSVDLGGSLKSIAGARRAGVTRFVQISAIDVDEELPADTDEVWRAYVEAKRDADKALRASDLDWTIIRPGRLTDDPAEGRVSLGPEVSRGDVTRGDVAAVVATCLDEPASIGRQWNLVGGDTPVAEAVTSAGADQS